MKLSLVAAAVAAMGFATPTSAFQSVHPTALSQSSTITRTGQLFAVSTNNKQDESSPCAMPNDVIPESVTAQGLRSAMLTNANGDKIRLGDQMGQGTSIVIFLRHLG